MTTVYGDLVRYRELFGNLFRRDVQAKYRGSLLGLAWTLANPVLYGRLPARVLGPWKTPFGVGGALRAFPARRAVGLDLLRHLGAGCIPVDAGQRQSHSQDAFPATAAAALDRRDAPDQLRRHARRPARSELRAATARSRDRVACTAARAGGRCGHVRSRARDRVAERVVPRPRVPGLGAAAPALLPDARPLSAQ